MVKDIQKEARTRYKYGEALQAAQHELAELMLERTEIDKRIARLKETIASLTYLSDGSFWKELEVRKMGLTKAVQYVLQTAGRPLQPVEIRDELAMKGYDIKRYADIIPSLHTILKRLFLSGRVSKITTGDGTFYEWRAYSPSPAEVLKTVGEKQARKKKG
jgi:hypothetical protein